MILIGEDYEYFAKLFSNLSLRVDVVHVAPGDELEHFRSGVGIICIIYNMCLVDKPVKYFTEIKNVSDYLDCRLYICSDDTVSWTFDEWPKGFDAKFIRRANNKFLYVEYEVLSIIMRTTIDVDVRKSILEYIKTMER